MSKIIAGRMIVGDDELHFRDDDAQKKLKDLIVQEKGNSKTAVMSQAAATEEFDKLSEEIDEKSDKAELNLITEGMVLNEPVNLLDAKKVHNGYYMDTNGVPQANGEYAYTEKIKVNAGDAIYCYYIVSDQIQKIEFRFVTAYDADGNVLRNLGGEWSNPYIVPESVAFISPTMYSSVITRKGMILANIPTISAYIPYHDPYYTPKSIPNQGWSVTGNMADGTVMKLPYTNINKNKALTFSAKVGTFDTINFKRGNSHVKINGTHISAYDMTSGKTYAFEHGLTITNNIQVLIESLPFNTVKSEWGVEDSNRIRVRLTSNGITYKTPDFVWFESSGYPYAESNGSVLNNCILSYIAKDINKNIFAFGDSYFTYSAIRWMGWFAEDGFDKNILSNAYPGETSNYAFQSFNNLIGVAKPKFVLWCLGMNDGSDTDINTPSNSWLTYVKLVVIMCERNGITPILATIPTVPSVNNEGKNAWVKNSGYRYIDFASAVGSTANGTWYSGMLDSDGVHPTGNGARALYMQAIADFPELMATN